MELVVDGVVEEGLGFDVDLPVDEEEGGGGADAHDAVLGAVEGLGLGESVIVGGRERCDRSVSVVRRRGRIGG